MSPQPSVKTHPSALEERAPLLDSHAPSDEEMARTQSSSTTPSTLELVGRNSAGSGWAIVTQLGLVMSTVALWRVLHTHPAGATPRCSLTRHALTATLSRRTLHLPSFVPVPRHPRLPRGSVTCIPGESRTFVLADTFVPQASSSSSRSRPTQRTNAKVCSCTKSCSTRAAPRSSPARRSSSTTRSRTGVRAPLSPCATRASLTGRIVVAKHFTTWHAKAGLVVRLVSLLRLPLN